MFEVGLHDEYSTENSLSLEYFEFEKILGRPLTELEIEALDQYRLENSNPYIGNQMKRYNLSIEERDDILKMFYFGGFRF